MRETLARGRDRVRITIRALTEKTGLSKETVSHALRQLSSPSVDLVNVVDAGGAHTPGHYQVRWYTYQKRTFNKPPAPQPDESPFAHRPFNREPPAHSERR